MERSEPETGKCFGRTIKAGGNGVGTAERATHKGAPTGGEQSLPPNGGKMSNTELASELRNTKQQTTVRVLLLLSTYGSEPTTIELDGTACGANERELKNTISGLLRTTAERIAP
jgi:hypothetical protein